MLQWKSHEFFTFHRKTYHLEAFYETQCLFIYLLFIYLQSTMQETSVGQSILDHSMSQDTMVIDAHMSGMLPSSQAGHHLPVQQEGTAMQTYTDEKGNIYQGEMGQGDAPALVPLATPQTIPPPPRGATQYIVSQVLRLGFNSVWSGQVNILGSV